MAPPDPRLTAWQGYYVIVGSSAAALIGLQFVVITLIAGMRRRPDPRTVSAFSTPTVVHLTGALLVSAMMSAPWPSLAPAGVVLALCGIGGLSYGAIVFRHARGQTGYQPVWEDWLWFLVLPFAAWAAVALGALLLRGDPGTAMFMIGAAALGLLFIGIHNAWDTVTHLVVTASRADPGTEPPPDAGPPNAEVTRSGSRPAGEGPDG